MSPGVVRVNSFKKMENVFWLANNTFQIRGLAIIIKLLVDKYQDPDYDPGVVLCAKLIVL